MAITSTGSLETVLTVVTETARELTGAYQVTTILTQLGERPMDAISLSYKYAPFRNGGLNLATSALCSLVCQSNRSVRLNDAELTSNAVFGAVSRTRRRSGPFEDGSRHRSWTATPRG